VFVHTYINPFVYFCKADHENCFHCLLRKVSMGAYIALLKKVLAKDCASCYPVEDTAES